MGKCNIRDLLLEELTELTLEVEDFEDAIKKIDEDAYWKGYAKEGSADAIIRREKLYPTALPTEVLKAVIPHPMGRDTVKKLVITITKLKTPADFTLMGSGNETVPVNIILTFAVNGAKHQLTILQKLVGMFSEKEFIGRIRASTTPKEIMNSSIEPLS